MSSESALIYDQLEQYSHVAEAHDPLTAAWVAFMRDLSLVDLIPQMAKDVDPFERDDAWFVNYDYQGAFDRFISLLRGHLIHKTEIASSSTQYPNGKRGGKREMIHYVPDTPAPTTTRAPSLLTGSRGILIAEECFGDAAVTRITIEVVTEVTTLQRIYQAEYPHPLQLVQNDSPAPSEPCTSSTTRIFRGV